MAGNELNIEVKKRVIINILRNVVNKQPHFHLELFIEESAEEIVKLFEGLFAKV